MNPDAERLFNETFNNNFNSFSEWIFSLSGLDFTIAATTIAILMSTKLSTDQQNSIGNFFFLIGQVLITMNAQDVTKFDNIDNPRNVSIGDLDRRVNFLYQELMKYKNNI